MTVSLPSSLLYRIFPVLLLLGSLICEAVVPDSEKPVFFSEEGPHELLQAVFVSIGFCFALGLLLRVRRTGLRLWFGAAALGCFYVAGEELSWGQHLFGWSTPAGWDVINDQNETNLHNISDWFDQKPQILLQIGVLVGGLIVPFLQGWKPHLLPSQFVSVYPDSRLVPTALTAVLVKLIDTVQDLVDRQLFWRASEVLELFVYYFVLLYLITMWQRFSGPAQA